MIRESIIFGSKQIDFQISFSERKTLGIKVKPDLKVEVRAPADASIDKIKEILKKKAPWIIRQQSYFLSYHPITPLKKFIGGETHLYLGRQYRLKIIINENESVKLKGQFIEVQVKDISRVKDLVNNWYLNNAEEKLVKSARSLIAKFKKYRVEPSSIVLKDMPTRWGSCTPKGKIILNPELIKAPRGCREYVVIHELCHLVHHYHNQKFIDLQTKEMPDWEKWKLKLEKLMA
jgi:predicted metal-dependent hydrolase